MVNEEDLKAILRAGTYAATGMGKQSPVIIAVTDKSTRDAISDLTDGLKESLQSAGFSSKSTSSDPSSSPKSENDKNIVKR